MNIPIGLVKQLREETQVSIAECRKMLEETKGDLDKARKLLQEKGIAMAEKKAERVTGNGIIDSYLHQSGKIGVITEVLCETDFVARTAEFKNLAHEISMQVAAMDPKDVKVLLKQDYIRDGSRTIESLVKETIAKLGENIVVKKFARLEVGN